MEKYWRNSEQGAPNKNQWIKSSFKSICAEDITEQTNRDDEFDFLLKNVPVIDCFLEFQRFSPQ